jgi:hypothetical protein
MGMLRPVAGFVAGPPRLFDGSAGTHPAKHSRIGQNMPINALHTHHWMDAAPAGKFAKRR